MDMMTYWIILKDEVSDLIHGVIHFKELVDAVEVDDWMRSYMEDNPDYTIEDLFSVVENKFPVITVLSNDVDDFKVLEV